MSIRLLFLLSTSLFSSYTVAESPFGHIGDTASLTTMQRVTSNSSETMRASATASLTTANVSMIDGGAYDASIVTGSAPTATMSAIIEGELMTGSASTTMVVSATAITIIPVITLGSAAGIPGFKP